MNPIDSQNVLSQIRTSEEAERFLREVDLLLDSYFEVGESKKKELFESLSYPTSQMFTKIMEQFKGDHGVFEAFPKKLKNEIKNMKILRITVAFEPKESTIEQFSKWARDNMSKNVLVELTVNPGILGGAEITYEGQYKDYTLKTNLERVFNEKRNEIVSQLT